MVTLGVGRALIVFGSIGAATAGSAAAMLKKLLRFMTVTPFLFGCEFQKLTGCRRAGRHAGRATVGQHIYRAVGPDAHIPDARLQVDEQRFFRDYLIVDDRQP